MLLTKKVLWHTYTLGAQTLNQGTGENLPVVPGPGPGRGGAQTWDLTYVHIYFHRHQIRGALTFLTTQRLWRGENTPITMK